MSANRQAEPVRVVDLIEDQVAAVAAVEARRDPYGRSAMILADLLHRVRATREMHAEAYFTHAQTN